jgi:proline dehydrogenase
MLRKTLLYLSNQQKVFTFVRRNGLARRMASRFVAGETLEEAMTAVRALNTRGITASLDLLGESVHREEEARATAKSYLDLLDRIQSQKLDANVSLKLTAMGLDVSEDLCVANMQMVLDRARDYGSFVRIDMESSAYTERTLHMFEHRLYPSYPKHVGIVLQSYLRRTYADVEMAKPPARSRSHLQGRVSRAGVGCIPGQARRGRAVHPQHALAHERRQLPGHRHARRAHHR